MSNAQPLTRGEGSESYAGLSLPWLFGLSLLLLVTAYLVLVAPGASFRTLWLNDEMALTAGAYRAAAGQIPSVDFRSLLGAMVYYPAALGFEWGLPAASVLALGQVLTAALLLVILVLICVPRYPLIPSALLLVFLFALSVVPMKLGGTAQEVSFGVFYNRNSWAMFAALLLCYVPPRRPTFVTACGDVTAISLALLFLLLSTVNFGLVGVAFLVASLISTPYHRRLVVPVIALVGGVLLAVELSSGYVTAYLGNIRAAAGWNPDVAISLGRLVASALRYHVGMLAALAAATFIVWRLGALRLVDLAFVMGAAGICLVLGCQTGSDTHGVPALAAVFVCLAELARRTGANESAIRSPSTHGSPAGHVWILLAVVAVQPVSSAALAAAYFHSQASAPAGGTDRAFAGFLVAVPGAAAKRLVSSANSVLSTAPRARQTTLRAVDYLVTLDDGARLLARHVRRDQAIVVFDVTDPFSFALGLRPTRYGFPLFWTDRLPSIDLLPAPARFFSDAEFAMVPAVPYTRAQLENMMKAYGQHLVEAFEPVASSQYWQLWRKRERP